MATPQENLQRFQEISNRGLQDRLDPNMRARFDEALNRGLITSQTDTGKAQPEAQQPQKPGFFEEIVAPALAPVSEFAAAVNRGALQFAESLTIDPLNASAQLLGIESRIPKPSQTESVQMFTGGNFLEPGFARDVIRSSGEIVGPGGAVGALSRGVAGAVPAAQTIKSGIAQQLAKGSAVADVGLTAASGAGAQIGQEVEGDTGALVGSFLAPISAAGITGIAKSAAPKIFDAGKRGIDALSGAVSGMSDDGAATLLAETMIREGLSPDEVIKKIASLGPEAIPADAGVGFARLLRTASNEIPRLEGQAGKILAARGEGQASRIATAFDDATGTASLTADDEIIRLNKVLGPQINDAYTAARAKASQLFAGPRVSEGLSFAAKPKKSNLEKLLDNKFVAGSKIKNKVDLELNAKSASGETVTALDTVDATKRALDDEIQKALRAGSNNKSRSLVILKNSLLKEADAAIPEYKQARNLFAGKAALESATDQGSLFLKMKPRDIKDLTQSLGDSEKRFFQLGAKRAIMDKIDDVQSNADLVKRLFGKNGDVKKLEFLFDDKAAFNRFSDTLKQEAEFVMTRRAAQANSTTIKQGLDKMQAEAILNNSAEAVSSPVGAARVLGRVLGGLSQAKGSEANTRALEEVGDILLRKGVNPDNLRGLLQKGSAKRIENTFRRAIKKDLEAPRFAPISAGVAAEALNERAQ